MTDSEGFVPSLAHLEKLGRGRNASYLLGHVVSEEQSFDSVRISLRVNLDAYKHCLQLLFNIQGKKAGYVLFHIEEAGAFFRGMEVSPRFRGRGLARVFFATWLTLCLRLKATPRTITINKPLLSYIILSFGFIPRYKTIKFEVCLDERSGETMVWAYDKSTERTALSNKAVKSQRIRFVEDKPELSKTVYMNTEYFPSEVDQLERCIAKHMSSLMFKFAPRALEVDFCCTAFFLQEPVQPGHDIDICGVTAWDLFS